MQGLSADLLENQSKIHFFDCPDAESELPDCSRRVSEHECSMSCLQLWYNHIDHCDFCRGHIFVIEDSTCQNRYCTRIIELLKLREKITTLMANNKLVPGGYVSEMIQGELQVLLSLDYNNLIYDGHEQKNYIQRRTQWVFEILAYLVYFEKQMKNLGFKLEGDDLKTLMNFILTPK